MTTKTNVLITGGYGCIGAETAKWLIAQTDSSVIVCSRSVDEDRSERIFHEVDHSRISFVAGDVRDQTQIESILTEHAITHVVHMAALQTPDCNAHRDLGLQINLAGTQNVIEAIKRAAPQLRRFTYASSVAVYGPRDSYSQEQVPMLAEPNPVNVYGVWKLAGESLAKFFHEDTGISTLSLRPGVLFGPGRDAGLTSSPTTAMKCLALGKPYEIPFRSRQDYQYAPDVGAAVGHALTDDFDGYGVFTLPGRTLGTEQMVAAMREAAREFGIEDGFDITIGRETVPFICDLEFQPFLDCFPTVPLTPLEQAVRESLEVFLEQADRGWLTVE